MGKQLVQADKVLCKSVLQATMGSQSFRLTVQAGWTAHDHESLPNYLQMCALTSKVVWQVRLSNQLQHRSNQAAQVESGYSVMLMCMLHENLAYLCGV